MFEFVSALSPKTLLFIGAAIVLGLSFIVVAFLNVPKNKEECESKEEEESSVSMCPCCGGTGLYCSNCAGQGLIDRWKDFYGQNSAGQFPCSVCEGGTKRVPCSFCEGEGFC